MLPWKLDLESLGRLFSLLQAPLCCLVCLWNQPSSLLQSLFIVPCTQVAKPMAKDSLTSPGDPPLQIPALQIPSSSSPGWKAFWGLRIVSATWVVLFEASTFDALNTSPQRAAAFWTGESMMLPRWVIWRQFCCCCVTPVQWQALCDGVLLLINLLSFFVLWCFTNLSFASDTSLYGLSVRPSHVNTETFDSSHLINHIWLHIALASASLWFSNANSTTEYMPRCFSLEPNWNKKTKVGLWVAIVWQHRDFVCHMILF